MTITLFRLKQNFVDFENFFSKVIFPKTYVVSKVNAKNIEIQKIKIPNKLVVAISFSLFIF